MFIFCRTLLSFEGPKTNTFEINVCAKAKVKPLLPFQLLGAIKLAYKALRHLKCHPQSQEQTEHELCGVCA